MFRAFFLRCVRCKKNARILQKKVHAFFLRSLRCKKISRQNPCIFLAFRPMQEYCKTKFMHFSCILSEARKCKNTANKLLASTDARKCKTLSMSMHPGAMALSTGGRWGLPPLLNTQKNVHFFFRSRVPWAPPKIDSSHCNISPSLTSFV